MNDYAAAAAKKGRKKAFDDVPGNTKSKAFSKSICLIIQYTFIIPY